MPVSQKVILPDSSSKTNRSRLEEGIADIMVAWVSNSRRSFGMSFTFNFAFILGKINNVL